MPRDCPLILHTRVVTATGGGPEKTIFNSARFLVPFGYSVLCAYMHPPGDGDFAKLQEKAETASAQLVGIEDRGAWDFRVLRQLLAICRQRRVAIWHAHDYKSDLFGLILRPFWPMRLVTTVHGWAQSTLRASLYYWIDRRCLRRYERVICVSDVLHQECLAAKIPEDRCMLIENAIDTEQCMRRVPVEEAKRRLGFSPGRLLIGSAGRLSAEKDFVGLIRAVDRLLQGGRDVDLAIIGEGDQRRELESLIATLGRQDRVRLLGYRSDLVDLYQALDVFVLNSLREGLPNVLLEAMALDVPVLATRVGGIPRLVEHEVSGLLIGPGDGAALEQGLKRLLDQTALRQRFAAAGRQTIEERYSFGVRMAKVRAVYDSLLNGHIDPTCRTGYPVR